MALHTRYGTAHSMRQSPGIINSPCTIWYPARHAVGWTCGRVLQRTLFRNVTERIFPQEVWGKIQRISRWDLSPSERGLVFAPVEVDVQAARSLHMEAQQIQSMVVSARIEVNLAVAEVESQIAQSPKNTGGLLFPTQPRA